MSSLPDFLQPLEFFSQPFPHAAMEAAITRRDESIPHLLHALEWAEQNAEAANESQPPYMLHLFALYLLAQFRETRALPLIDRLFRHSEYEALTGDVVTEDLGRILASACGRNLTPIRALIEDPALDEWVRSAGLRALGVLLFTGGLSREETSVYFGTLFAGKLQRRPSHLWDALVSVCTDFRLSEHLDAIRAAYAEGLCDVWVDRLEDVENEIILPSANLQRVSWMRYQFIEDAIAEMKGWFCFEPPTAPARELDVSVPAVRDHPKIGRNDLCPCLSGKKYKKCCSKGG